MKRVWGTLLILFLAGTFTDGCGSRINNHINEQESAAIQTFTEEEVTVIPQVEQYDFARATEKGITKQIRGILPGTTEGTWYTVSIDGVEYYYGQYDSEDAEEAECYGYAIISENYSLQNGITTGTTMEEVLEKYPNMAVMDFEGNYLDKGVTGHMGWNGIAYPRSLSGMDENLEYDGKYYEWSDQFDCVMIADIELEVEDALPVCLALLVKDNMVAAITFYYPTAG